MRDGKTEVKQLHEAIEEWVNTENRSGNRVPDFWDETCTSERLAYHLASKGFVCAAAIRAADLCETHLTNADADYLDLLASQGSRIVSAAWLRQFACRLRGTLCKERT